MDFDLPEALMLLKEIVRSFVDRELIPIGMEATDGADMKPDIRAKLGARAHLGLWLLDVPEQYGDQGLSLMGDMTYEPRQARPP